MLQIFFRQSISLVSLYRLELPKSIFMLFSNLSKMAILREFTAIYANPFSVVSGIFSKF